MITDRLFWTIMLVCLAVLGVCECGPVIRDCGAAFAGEEMGR